MPKRSAATKAKCSSPLFCDMGDAWSLRFDLLGEDLYSFFCLFVYCLKPCSTGISKLFDSVLVCFFLLL